MEDCDEPFRCSQADRCPVVQETNVMGAMIMFADLLPLDDEPLTRALAVLQEARTMLETDPELRQTLSDPTIETLTDEDGLEPVDEGDEDGPGEAGGGHERVP